MSTGRKNGFDVKNTQGKTVASERLSRRDTAIVNSTGMNYHLKKKKKNAVRTSSRQRYSSCRYNERQLIDVTVVRRVRLRVERSCGTTTH